MRLEHYQLPHLGIKRIGDARQIVDADTYFAGLDAPDVRFAAAHHERELLL